MKIKKALSLSLIFSLMLLLCGFGLINVTVLVDTDKNHVYEYIPAEDILSEYAKNMDAAKAKYKDGYYLITGKIGDVSKKGDKVNIYGSSISDGQIICSCPKELRAGALNFKKDDSVGIYGKITFSPLDKEIHFNAEKLAAAPSGVRKGTFCLADGKSIDRNSMISRTLNNGKVSYKIPAAWKGVEHSIIEDGIGTMDGYQYVLNRLPGSTDDTPESFFVCYFDNASRLENQDDKKDTLLIEKAIINNISGDGKADLARIRNVSTYYGAKYNYFITSYTDTLDAGNNGYHVEYIFQRDGDDGLVMYLYVYKDAKHLSDVLFVTRFLSIPSH